MDNVEFCSAEGVCEKMTGCERFGNICYVRQVVKIALAVGIILGVVAATFSEKVRIYEHVLVPTHCPLPGLRITVSTSQVDTDAVEMTLHIEGLPVYVCRPVLGHDFRHRWYVSVVFFFFVCLFSAAAASASSLFPNAPK